MAREVCVWCGKLREADEGHCEHCNMPRYSIKQQQLRDAFIKGVQYYRDHNGILNIIMDDIDIDIYDEKEKKDYEV